MSRQERPDARDGLLGPSQRNVGAVTFLADRTEAEGDAPISAVLECLVFIDPWSWN